MATKKEGIQRGLALFRDLVREIPELEEELQTSFAEFTSLAPQAPGAALAAQRHFEWFLLERPSSHLGGIPAEILRDAWIARAGPEEKDFGEVFLTSIAGVFEISSTGPGAVLWVRDLFGLGEHPVEEPEAASELLPGDLLVGRLFPAGQGVFHLSAAVMCFRNPRLVEAVREDLQRMRAVRRGVLRVQQIELERLFFSARVAEEQHSTRVDQAALSASALDRLQRAGLSPSEARAAVDRALAARSGTDVTDLLNELAFETTADLAEARNALVELWTSKRSQELVSQVPANPAQEPSDDVQSALAAFDQGRAAGKDLEELFAALARDLGIGDLDDEEEDATSPDFPGVVAAMVEEFLWDVGREEGPAAVETLEPIWLFARYGSGIGVFENLGQNDLVDFCARWLLDESGLTEADDYRSAIQALERFCRWCEEHHSIALFSALQPNLEALLEAVPRLSRARPYLVPRAPEHESFEVLRSDPERFELRRLSGGEMLRPDAHPAAALLRPGELVRGSLQARSLQASAVYPAQLWTLLSSSSGAS